MMDKQKKLVRTLLARTKRGDVEWKESIPTNAYQVSFKDNSVLIRLIPGKRDEPDDYEMSLLDAEARTVDSFTDVDLAQTEADSQASSIWFKTMRELYDLARRTALGSEKVLNEILKDLGDDEIPF